MVKSKLNLLGSQLGAERFARTAKADILGDNSAIPSQAQAGELEIDTAGVQIIQQ